MEATSPKFENVFCSQCGRDFGPGDHGFSSCASHASSRKVSLKVLDIAADYCGAVEELREAFPASNFAFRAIGGGFELRIPDGYSIREWCAATAKECAMFAIEEMA